MDVKALHSLDLNVDSVNGRDHVWRVLASSKLAASACLASEGLLQNLGCLTLAACALLPTKCHRLPPDSM